MRSGNLVVVVGAGVTASLSSHAAASSWTGLLRDGIRAVSLLDSDRSVLLEMRLEQASSSFDYASIAQDIRRDLGENFGRWISRAIGDLPLQDAGLAEAIAQLRAPILTTNYDRLLEKALSRGTVSWANPSEMRNLLFERSTEIGHLHGVYTDSDKIVFSDQDYRELVSSTAAQQIQTAAFTMSVFLFVGMGEGLADPNFDPMVKQLERGFPDSPQAHFRLCLDTEVDAATELASVIDVGYGAAHSDLPDFLTGLVAEADLGDLDLTSISRRKIVERLRDNSTLWRDAASLDEKGFYDLVIPPTFLPEPHNEYANSSAALREKDRPTPVDIDQRIRDGGILIVAGEENSGVTTALSFVLHRALDILAGRHSIMIERPAANGPTPVRRVVERTYRDWGCAAQSSALANSLVLGVDNLRVDGLQRTEKAIADIVNVSTQLTVIGARQADAVELATQLASRGAGAQIVYLGRFSDHEAHALAERVVPGRAVEVARNAMNIVREKNLPRTPFTLTLLVELVQTGTSLRADESEIAVLDQYLDLLLMADFARAPDSQGMSLRQKRKALEVVARKFVEQKEDHAALDLVAAWMQETFVSLGWSYSVGRCIEDLKQRRILSDGPDGRIRFQRSAYLELMAGIAAREDSAFRSLVFEAPIQLASIVRSYAAMARNDEDVLRLVESEIARIQIGPLKGLAFSRVKRIEAREDLFTDRSEPASEVGADETAVEPELSVERSGMTGSYYDDTPDIDSPAFLTAHLDELSAARVAMLVVDLASRVLRDSDEVPNQELKAQVLHKLLRSWVAFADIYEVELSESENLEEVARAVMSANSEEPSDAEVKDFTDFMIKVMPIIVADSGISYCLASPTLISRLVAAEFTDEDGFEVGLVRTVALIRSGGHQWVASLSSLSDDAVRSFFCATFLAALARYEYLTDATLSDDDRGVIRAFLRRVIGARYNFRDIAHRQNAMNEFESKLARDLLLRRTRAAVEI